MWDSGILDNDMRAIVEDSRENVDDRTANHAVSEITYKPLSANASNPAHMKKIRLKIFS